MRSKVHTTELDHDNARPAVNPSTSNHTDLELLHARWVVACGQLRAAYQRWCKAPAEAGTDGYVAVLAMADQEAAAAAAYGRALRCMSDAVDRVKEVDAGTASVVGATERRPTHI
jgi:hypothetical protein